MSRYIAVYSATPNVNANDLSWAIRAITKQIERDLYPSWSDHAYIAFSPTAEVGPGWDTIGIYDNLPYPGGNGLHGIKNGQPVGFVRYSDYWTIDLSHEILEMVVDPWGRRMLPGPAVNDPSRRVQYLVEVCDMCQDFDDSYFVDGVRVSNFCTPHYFAPPVSGGIAYSMANASNQPVLTGPHQVRPGGYLTWYDEYVNRWYMADWLTDSMQIKQIPAPSVYFSTLRAGIDAYTETKRDTWKEQAHAARSFRRSDFFDVGTERAAKAKVKEIARALKTIARTVKRTGRDLRDK